MPVIKPASLVWECLDCGHKIIDQPSKDAYKERAFEHQKDKHLLTDGERDFFMSKFMGFYRIS